MYINCCWAFLGCVYLNIIGFKGTFHPISQATQSLKFQTLLFSIDFA